MCVVGDEWVVCDKWVMYMMNECSAWWMSDVLDATLWIFSVHTYMVVRIVGCNLYFSSRKENKRTQSSFFDWEEKRNINILHAINQLQIIYTA